MPSQYALHVFSHPTNISDSLWQKWYETEHITDMVHSGAAKRATLYRVKKSDDLNKKFFAIYQTDFKECLVTDNYRNNVRHTSELFEDSEKMDRDYGAFDPRNYELIQCYDPKNVGDSPAPFATHVEITPASADELDKWYKEEHLEMLSKIPGWRRTLRYKLTKLEPHAAKDATDFATIHEYDNLDSNKGPEAQAMRNTEWAKRMTGEDAKVFRVSAWEMASSVGF